ncbi:hypothetical protein OQJ46_00790 [Microbulbifer thermotolerans]|uniref:hypothetical protein n=1 Tax=Microbulbifer thermotolerans TaxID=252514 RepID=UPI00224B5FC5|nr:hypothetical protein [Microbulbifer thermotolerans]MCX2781524.1 hypothetical protein [Microbulbifer thermotolerans]MCX2842310.1 hypothetical protein [Microbulbifer thermotolerans]
MQRLDNPSSFYGWAAIVVGGLFLSLSIFLLANLPSAKEMKLFHGVVERSELKSGGKGSDIFLLSVDGEKFRYSGFWSKDVYKSIVGGSEVGLNYYRSLDGNNQLVSLRVGNTKVLSKFQSLSSIVVFASAGILISLLFIFTGLRDLRKLRNA